MKAWAIFQQSRSRTFQSEKDSEKMKTAREGKRRTAYNKSPDSLLNQGSQVKMAASYSPALHCSTIGAGGLNFSVRNGKRWDPAAITTWYRLLTISTSKLSMSIHNNTWKYEFYFCPELNTWAAKAIGQLVRLGFDVTVFTPASYQRPRLGRPSWSSHLAEGFALRCFQRLSIPDADTRRCTWRHNRQTGGLSTTVLSY